MPNYIPLKSGDIICKGDQELSPSGLWSEVIPKQFGMPVRFGQKMRRVDKPNVLDGALLYLCGPMQFAADSGVQWRQYFTKEVKTRGLPVKIIDPTNKPGPDNDVHKEIGKSNQFREAKDWAGLKKFVKEYRHYDLRAVDYCNCLIARIDTKIHMTGSYNEIYVGESESKPILAIVPDGIASLPDWMFAVLDLDCIFTTEDECLDYLERLNNNEEELSDKWLLLQKHL